MGGSLAVAGLGALLAARLAHELVAELGARAGQVDPDRLLQGAQAAAALRDGTQAALASALHSVWLVLVPLAAVGVACALALQERPLRSREPEPQAEVSRGAAAAG